MVSCPVDTGSSIALVLASLHLFSGFGSDLLDTLASLGRSRTMPNPTEPHPLRGITCTNDDPDSCALCSKEFPDGPIHIVSSGLCYVVECCGKRLCGDCFLDQSALGGVHLKCKLCPSRYYHSLNAKKNLTTLKKHAKKGRAWAQFVLAIYSDCRGAKFDAIHLFRKAVKGGHPDAMLCLADMIRRGEGCKRNLDEAESLVDRSVSVAPRLMGHGVQVYADIATEYLKLGSDEYHAPKDLGRAKSILLPLAQDGHDVAQYQLGTTFYIMKDYDASRKWCTEAIFSCETATQKNVAVSMALFDSLCLSDFPQAKVWADGVKSTGFLDAFTSAVSDAGSARTRRMTTLISVRRGLLDLRKACATCGLSLDRTTRKLCKGCKAHCYCSTQCQEKHWNKAKGGHRAECKGAQALKKRIKDENLLEKWIKDE